MSEIGLKAKLTAWNVRKFLATKGPEFATIEIEVSEEGRKVSVTDCEYKLSGTKSFDMALELKAHLELVTEHEWYATYIGVDAFKLRVRP